jgi:hypothetical protein
MYQGSPIFSWPALPLLMRAATRLDRNARLTQLDAKLSKDSLGRIPILTRNKQARRPPRWYMT